MPYFSSTPSSGLAASLRRAVGGLGGGALDPLQAIQIDRLAADTAHKLTLSEKLRVESENLRRAGADRQSPELASEYASNAAGIDIPTGTRLSNHLRGVLEQPSAADIDDSAAVGREAEPFRTGAPNIEPGKRRLYQSAIAATIANRLATGKTNAQQLTAAGGNVQGDQLTEEAIQAPTNTIANRIIAAASGKTYAPFRTNAQGTVIDEGTGNLAEGSQLAARVRALAGARAGAASAAAGASTAAAGASNARREFIAGPQTRLASARAEQVVAGRPATPIAPQRVARMIDMSTLAEFKAEKAAWDALPLSKRNATPAPSMAAVRDRVASRYSEPNTAQEISDANAALNAPGQTEANRKAIRARFRQRKGFDLPAQVSAAAAAAGDDEDDEG